MPHLYPKRALLDGAEVEIFKLLSYGATPEQWAEWLRAPLEHAAARGNLDLVLRLLKAGGDGSAGWRGCRGRTLLDAAALGGNPDVLSALLRAGCRPDINVVSAFSGRSALHTSVVCGHTEVARKLILAGANVRHVDPADRCGPLHVAAAGAHHEVVSDLLLRGASTRARDVKGRSPLHTAAGLGHAKVVSVLLDNAAHVDDLDHESMSPLMLASDRGHLSTATLLLSAGADVTMRNDPGVSALDLAASAGNVGVINAILGHGADVNEQDIVMNWTPLHHASCSGGANAVDVLLDAGAKIDQETSCKLTPLHLAAFKNLSAVLRTLLRRGADATKEDRHGNTALHRVCRRRGAGLEKNVDLLLRCGASETAVSRFGKTPADHLEASLSEAPATGTCPAAEVERVRALLARAPADRAWRRRHWIVMLRARAERERLAHLGGIDNGSQPGEGEGSRRDKVGRADSGGGASAGGGGGRHAGDERSGAATRGEFGDLVTALVGVKSEGVFRKIVGYL